MVFEVSGELISPFDIFVEKIGTRRIRGSVGEIAKGLHVAGSWLEKLEISKNYNLRKIRLNIKEKDGIILGN